MHLDVSSLRQRHPLLPLATATEYVHRAAMGLQRAGHEPGCQVDLEILQKRRAGTLDWTPSDSKDLNQLDSNRVTEDAAEAISLVLVHEAERWQTVRRLQREEVADWLLARPEEGRLMTLALEISGTTNLDGPFRLRKKLAQVAKSECVDRKAAAVVGLSEPWIAFQLLRGGR